MISFLMTIASEEMGKGIEYLYKHYHRDMLIYAKELLKRSGCRNYELDAEDVIQRTYIKLFESGKIDFTKSEREIKSYLISTVHSVFVDHLRENRKYASDGEFDDSLEISDNSFYEELRIKERYGQVVDAIKELDLIYSSTLFLTVEGMKPAEIAEYMGISEQTVYTRLRRARIELIGILKEKENYANN